MYFPKFLPFGLLSQSPFNNVCPIDTPYSCTNSTPIANSCCFENPGGILLLTQFWDYYPPIGDNHTFTLHGLWPDKCDGSYEQFCNPSLETQNVREILNEYLPRLVSDMDLYWKNFNGNDDLLWKHEFNKHGTCVKTIDPHCYSLFKDGQNVFDYFNVTMNLYKSLPTFEFLQQEGIVPDPEKTYTKAQIDNALTKHFGEKVYFKCNKYHGLQEVWYYHHLKGSLLQENFKPIEPLHTSNCPEYGIRFFPKGSFGREPPRTPQRGKRGFLKIADGCLISNGKYFTKGTCATFRVKKAEFGGYNLISRRGTCGIENGAIICNKANKTKTQFALQNGRVGFNNNFKWCTQGDNDQKNVILADGTCESFEITFQE